MSQILYQYFIKAVPFLSYFKKQSEYKDLYSSEIVINNSFKTYKVNVVNI